MKKTLFSLITLFFFAKVNSQNAPNIEKIDDAVVAVIMYDVNGEIKGYGSGFIIDGKGTVVTNYHVIEDAFSLKVRLEKNGRTRDYAVETIISADEKKDLALIAIKNEDSEVFPFLVQSKIMPKKGDECWAIGTPADLAYMNTVSKGLIANVNSEVSPKYFQINAGITHGSSGGALINSKGEAIGITSAGDESKDGARASINFAISIIEINNLKPVNKKNIIVPNSIPCKLSFYTNDPFIGNEYYYGTLVLNAGECKVFRVGKQNIDYTIANKVIINPAYDIKINFKNCKDTVMYLAFYQFDKSYLADTCKKVVNGQIIFKGNKPLQKGVYYLVSQDKARYFDFFISDNNQKMTMSTDTADLVKNLKCVTHKENDDFFAYIKFITAKNKEYADVKSKTKGLNAKDSAAFMMEKGKVLNETVIAYENAFLESHKGTFVGDVINLKMEKEAKDIPKASNGRPDSMYIYNYYKNHYWDGVNLQDDGIMRTPFFSDRLKKYFNNVIVQHPDTMSAEIDRFMAKTKAGTMMQKLLIAHFLFTSESSKLMGFDKVFVHVIDKYIRTGMAKEVYDEATIAKIKERGDILKPLLLGSQAPDLLMIDTIGHKQIAKMGFDTVKTSAGATKLYYDNAQNLAQLFVPLYGVKADYIMLVFWDVDCGHCKTEIPKLIEEYHTLKKEDYDIKVFSVYTQQEYEKYRKYIIENKLDWINVYDGVHINNIKEKYDIYSTPVIYMLDRNKRIKAKRIGTEQVKDIVKQMEKEYKAEKK